MLRFSSLARYGSPENLRYRSAPARLFLSLLLCCAVAGMSAAPSPAFPEAGTGWDISYAPLALEDFSTLVPTIDPTGEIGEIGSLTTEKPLSGRASLAGANAGLKTYQHYFSTRPELLPLKGGVTYRLTLSYRIIDAGDKGFEMMFYSPTGGEAGRWLDGITLRGAEGTRGVAELERTLYDFADYRVWLNVIGRGAIVVDDIRLSEGGRTIFKEDFEGILPGPGPQIRTYGSRVDTEGRLSLADGARIETDPTVIVLPKMTELRISFDYSIIARTIYGWNLDLRLFPAPNAQESVSLRPLLRNAPATGRFSTGFGRGSAGPYRISIQAGTGSRVLIDNILIEKGTARSFAEEPASYAYLRDAPFPRLGNNNQISPTEQVSWGGFEEIAWRSTVEEEERRLALFDIIFGFDTFHELYDSDLPNRIKALNPNAVLLPYVIGQESSAFSNTRRLESADPDGNPAYRYENGLASEWLVKDTKGIPVNDLGYPGILKLDISPGAIKVGGKNFLDYQIGSFRRDFFESGVWDGLFIDNLFARMNGHIPNAYMPEKLDYDINRNGKRDETPVLLNRISYEAERKLLEGLVAGIGNRELLIGNNGPLPETRLAPYVNGYVFENFNQTWDNSNPGGYGLSESGWRRAMDAYRIMDENCRSPRVNVIEAWGKTDGYDVATEGRIDPTPVDFARNRFALGTALLGNAYYEYDLTEARSSITWFDEYSVGADGIARESAEGKGYLGKALGPAIEMATPLRKFWGENFEGWNAQATGGGEGSRLSKKADEVIAGKRSMVFEGKLRHSDAWPAYETWGAPLQLRKGKTYLIEFAWKVLEDLDYGFWFTIRSKGDESGTPVDALFAGEEGRCRYPFTPRADGEYVMRFAIFSAGKITIDDIKVSEGGVGPWRRDFENGFVLVNPYRSPALFDIKTLNGALGRSGIRRIKGGQAPEVNTGKPVTTSLRLEPFDAIILLADHREALIPKP
jgi:hypothetical protein